MACRGILYILCQLVVLRVHKCVEYVHISQMVEVGTPWDPSGVTEVFETIVDVSLQSCVDHCKMRSVCSFVNYKITAHVCFILEHKDQNQDVTIRPEQGYATGIKAIWDMSKYADCVICSKRETCLYNSGLTDCVITGCGTPTIHENVAVLGNVYSIGSRLGFTCIDGVHPQQGERGRITCLSTGLWKGTNFTCSPERISTTTNTATTSTTAATTVTATATVATTAATTAATTTATTVATTATTATSAASTTATSTTTPPPFSCHVFDNSYRTVQLIDGSSVTYKIVIGPALSTDDASQKCRHDGGELIKVITHARMNFIFQLTSCPAMPFDDIWIDGMLNMTTGLWKTTDGDAVPLSLYFWQVGRPDALATQHCIRLKPTAGFKFDNKECFVKNAYMCELL